MRGHSTDSSHPPTHLRRALVAGARDEPAAVVLTAEDDAAIDAELAGVGQRVAALTLRDVHL